MRSYHTSFAPQKFWKNRLFQCIGFSQFHRQGSQPATVASYPLICLAWDCVHHSFQVARDICQTFWVVILMPIFLSTIKRWREEDSQFSDSSPHKPSSNLHAFLFIPSTWVKTYTNLAFSHLLCKSHMVLSCLILKYGHSLHILVRKASDKAKAFIKYFSFFYPIIITNIYALVKN